MTDPSLYDGREQTRIKHIILQKYLERFAHIVGSFCDTLTYVDCFSGPWNVNSEEFEDSSFHIALAQLRTAQHTLALRGIKIKIRCFFLEENPAAYAKLKGYADSIKDAEVVAHNGRLEDLIPKILAFVQEGGRNAFPFFFIDPTGWTGFSMKTIKPLLSLKRGEVLINFMMNYINRFIEADNTQESFHELFGTSDFREKIQGLEGQERQDAIVLEYSRNVKMVGGFEYVRSAIILHPEKDRSHFNLIYATRSAKGVEAFKDAEKAAMKAQEQTRANAEAKDLATIGQTTLFSESELPYNHQYYQELRKRYVKMAKSNVMDELTKCNILPYDTAWEVALAQPLVWESDLKEWIKKWQESGQVDVVGLTGRKRTPKYGQTQGLRLKTR